MSQVVPQTHLFAQTPGPHKPPPTKGPRLMGVWSCPINDFANSPSGNWLQVLILSPDFIIFHYFFMYCVQDQAVNVLVV